MSVNAELTVIRPTVTDLLCRSCGAPKALLSAEQQCHGCEAAALRRQIAADELRSWKRYSPGSFR